MKEAAWSVDLKSYVIGENTYMKFKGASFTVHEYLHVISGFIPRTSMY